MSERGEVQDLSVSQLVPDPDNVNLHDETNIQQIAASIQRFGFADPIGVVEMQDKPGHFMIVEGHGRLEAAKYLKLKKVPCIVLTLTEAEQRGYSIAHNQIQRISSLNLDVVGGEFSRLGVGTDDHLSLGFTAEDVMFLPTPTHTAGDAFSAPGGGDYREDGDEGSTSGLDEGSKIGGGFAPTVHRTEMRFASDIGYNRFVAFLSLLRGHYPVAETHGERIRLYLADKGLVAAGETGTNGDA